MNLLKLIPTTQQEAVFGQEMCDIDAEFLGFMEVYESLAKLIPKHWTVIDLGCAYAPQCYYFANHKEYIGVDIADCIRFSTPNTVHFKESIEEFVTKRAKKFDPEKTFAICSYVPPWGNDNMKIVRENFKNVFTYYPHH